ncbi:alpha/beta hydrolase [Pseudomonas sp. TWP3-1]|uniref:alpha/beta hydrolase n=1 Tax=Pseudomonas sp. TWP3-1 TaxID=2804631 RepID=UPI003CE91F44
MSKTLMSLVALIVGIYLVLCLALFVFQRSLIYFPQPAAVDSPDSRLTLAMQDAQIRVTVREQVGSKALIYFGGNAEDVSRNLPEFAEAFPGYALYFLHYRGFGGSEGAPSEEAIAEDALALFDQVYASHPQVALIGRSLGSGVAVRLASQRPATQLILVTPYNSLEEIAAGYYPWLPVKWLLKDRYQSGKYAAHISVPTLLLVASEDEVIPRLSSERLLESFPKGVATLKVVADSGHNSISERTQYLQWIGDFLNQSIK